MELREYRYYVYIMASRSRTLYIGFTSRLEHRVHQHQDDALEGFTKKYQCHRLVYIERFGSVDAAIAREKQLKRWSRAKKITLIKRENPAWYDLSEEWSEPLPLGKNLQVSPLRLRKCAKTPVEMTHLRQARHSISMRFRALASVQTPCAVKSNQA